MENNNDNTNAKIPALIIAIIASFLTPFMGSAINIALPSIGNEFLTNAVLLGWVPTAFLLAAAIFAVPFGRIADIYGMKKVFTYGMIIFTISSLLSAIAPSAVYLIAFRVVQGIGSAMIFVTGLAIVTSVYPPHERGKAIGFTIGAVYIGLSLGPALGGILTQYFGWRSLFYLMVPIGIMVIALIFWKLKGEWAACQGEKFDVPSTILYSLALLTFMFGFSELPGIIGIIMIIIGAVGLAAFVMLELKVKVPVFNMRLFKNTTFAFSSLAALINYMATFAVVFFLSLYLQYIKGLDPQTAGFILVAQPVIMAVLAPVAGKLSDKYEPRIIASIGMGLTTIGLSFFIFLDMSTSILFIILGLIILGCGFGLFSSPNTNAIMGSVERRFVGIASATVSTMRLIGQTLSMGIAILILSLIIGKVMITADNIPDLLGSIQLAFTVFTILCFIGIFISMAGKKKKIEKTD
ncbi:MAG: MFS transporter [Methanobacterium sp.]|uniref:MFS transporter n=1 Tax=Methanobacterium sp. TaxID=2164 RepID=UPI003D653854|nr:MFS transporter [Methanobacterium sp.]